MPKRTPVELEFSRKYNRDHALQYYKKHHETLGRRLSHFRDEQMLRRALKIADNPTLVLDLPCGAGRFWPLLAEQPNRIIMAADNSADMLATALENQPKEIAARTKTFQTSAFSIDLDDNAVDCIFSIRLLHHVAEHEHRLQMLREFQRVTRDTVILSLWVDGNYKAWRRKRREKSHAEQGRANSKQNRFVVNREVIESEFKEAGFTVIGRQDFLPGYAMWRVYTLRKNAI